MSVAGIKLNLVSPRPSVLAGRLCKAAWLALLLAAVMSALLILAVSLVSAVSSYNLLVVTSNSMRPGIETGDAVLVRELTEAERFDVQSGQVLLFARANR